MTLFLELAFWILFFIPIHSYLLYPLIIRIISKFFGTKRNLAEQNLTISILISAFNEEKVIENRINNISKLNYDFNKIEVLVGSDCSSDKTNEILTGIENKYSWLKIYLFGDRRGKVSVLNDLVKNARNEILVFTDANTVFNENSIKILVSNFNDKLAGGVSGRLILTDAKNGISGNIEEKSYWEYETLLKKYEGKCGILIGANGGIFAIRKDLFKEIPMEESITDDLYISLAVLNQNYKFLYEENAVAYEETPTDIIVEFNRKIRFASTNFYTLTYFKNLLFNKNLLLSFAFLSHKIIRWFTPIILPIILLINLLLFSY
ncbi:MAG: glycosyltransferase, partial [Ignavibacteria bacterium]